MYTDTCYLVRVVLFVRGEKNRPLKYTKVVGSLFCFVLLYRQHVSMLLNYLQEEIISEHKCQL